MANCFSDERGDHSLSTCSEKTDFGPLPPLVRHSTFSRFCSYNSKLRNILARSKYRAGKSTKINSSPEHQTCWSDKNTQSHFIYLAYGFLTYIAQAIQAKIISQKV